MSWKYTDSSNRVVARVLENGGIESCLVEAIADWIAQGNTPAAADAPSLDQLWEKIKAERDRRRFDGGVKVGDRWFLSTAIAAGEYNSLALLSAGLPDATVLRANWRTMDGALVDMTPLLVRQILSAGFAAVAAIDDAAQVHRAAMEASPDPDAYDFSGSWPQTYAESLLQA